MDGTVYLSTPVKGSAFFVVKGVFKMTKAKDNIITKEGTALSLNQLLANHADDLSKTEEKSFEELLDDYLNKNEIEKKKEFDNLEMAKEEKKIAIEEGINYDNTITIYEFLKNYLHTRMNPEFNRMTLTALKYLGFNSSFVMGVHENFAKNNPELLDQEFLLLVKDAEHNRAVYINPYFISKLLEDEKINLKLKEFSSMKTIDLEDIGEYYNEYQRLLCDKEDNEITQKILKRTHKEKKFIKLKEIIGKSDNND